MSKKLITACMALFALAAFVLPASASATSPVLTAPTGTAVAVGTKIQATNVGETFFKNSEGTSILTRCTTAKMTGEVKTNSGGIIEGTISTATFSGSGAVFDGMNECTGTFGNLTVTTNGNGVDENTVPEGTPYCLKASGPENTFTLRGGACGSPTRKITFIFETTLVTGGSTPCKYERPSTEPITGTYTTDTTGDAIATVLPAGSKFTGEVTNSPICPPGGSLEMSFTLETDPEPGTPGPVYIS